MTDSHSIIRRDVDVIDWNSLPIELQAEIFSLLCPFQLILLNTLCKQSYAVLSQNLFWLQQFRNEFGHTDFKDNAKAQFIAAYLYRIASLEKRLDVAQIYYRRLVVFLDSCGEQPWIVFYRGVLNFHGLGVIPNEIEGLKLLYASLKQDLRSKCEIASMLIRAPNLLERQKLLDILSSIEVASICRRSEVTEKEKYIQDELITAGVLERKPEKGEIEIVGQTDAKLNADEIASHFLKSTSEDIKLKIFKMLGQDLILDLINWLQAAYTENLLKDMFETAHAIGKLYLLEQGKPDKKQAEQWLEMALDTTFEAALEDILALKLDDHDGSSVIKYLENLLTLFPENKAIIVYNIGCIWCDILDDRITGASEYRAASALNYAPAQRDLGYLYLGEENNAPSSSSLKAAVDEFKAAFANGDETSGEEIYKLLDNKDANVTLQIFQDAYLAGNSFAAVYLGRSYSALSKEQCVSKPENIVWLQLAAQHGCNNSLNFLTELSTDNAYACIALGIIYTLGICYSEKIAADTAKAKDLFAQAIKIDPESGSRYLQIAQIDSKELLPDATKKIIEREVGINPTSSLTCG